jgi:hypothetical protein
VKKLKISENKKKIVGLRKYFHDIFLIFTDFRLEKVDLKKKMVNFMEFYRFFTYLKHTSTSPICGQ